ncbi:MAG TPA: YbhN family protein [Candidatus Saccharimonadales bacterium]|nr:YbhN family protein [Candidatus Saccharimonadales bacterium]
MAKPKPTSTRSLLLRIALTIALLVVAGWILGIHWDTVRRSLQVARAASTTWLAAALLGAALTYCIAAGIYGVLALHRLRYRQTIVVELATAFVNRLLPSGLGGLGLHGLYLYRRKHTAAEATVVVSINNLIGMVAHLVLLAGVLCFYPGVLQRFIDGNRSLFNWRIGAGVAILVAAALMLPVIRHKLASFAQTVLASLRKMRPPKLLLALLLAALLTTTYTCVLWAVCHSLQLSLNVLQVFIVFSLGMLTSTATPTPGGLVGAEAGLFAGLVAYHVAAPPAGAAVLLYRLLTYWLPLLPGLFMLWLARRRQLV